MLFNLKDDPYELRNICDQEKTLCDQMSAHVWQTTGDYSHVVDVPTANAQDPAMTGHDQFPTRVVKMTYTVYGVLNQNF